MVEQRLRSEAIKEKLAKFKRGGRDAAPPQAVFVSAENRLVGRKFKPTEATEPQEATAVMTYTPVENKLVAAPKIAEPVTQFYHLHRPMEPANLCVYDKPTPYYPKYANLPQLGPVTGAVVEEGIS